MRATAGGISLSPTLRLTGGGPNGSPGYSKNTATTGYWSRRGTSYPGSNWIQEMQTGTRDATRTIAVLSDDYLASQYGSAEWQAAWASDPAGAARKLLTVRVADCERPGSAGRGDRGGPVRPTTRPKPRPGFCARWHRRSLAGPNPPQRRDSPAGAGRCADEPRFPGSVPRIWKVPPRNPNFTGRDRTSGTWPVTVAARSRVMVQSLHGMGGVGKTQLATEYAHTRMPGTMTWCGGSPRRNRRRYPTSSPPWPPDLTWTRTPTRPRCKPRCTTGCGPAPARARCQPPGHHHRHLVGPQLASTISGQNPAAVQLLTCVAPS